MRYKAHDAVAAQVALQVYLDLCEGPRRPSANPDYPQIPSCSSLHPPPLSPSEKLAGH